MTIKAIWCQSGNHVIGKNGKLPWYIPEELEHFKRTTMGATLVMGRETYESLPKPLDGRNIIVMTRNSSYKVDDPNVYVAHYKFDAEFIHATLTAQGKSTDDLFICGGASIYKMFAKDIDEFIVSILYKHIHGENLTYIPQEIMDAFNRKHKYKEVLNRAFTTYYAK